MGKTLGNCKIEGCPNEKGTRGWCNKHYLRWRRHGDTSENLVPNRGKLTKFIEEIVASDYFAEGCMQWPFGRGGTGYSAMGGGHKVSRIICKMVYGEPESNDLQAAHSCGDRNCVNPSHLRWASQSENESDKVEHGRSNRGSRGGGAKLREDQVLEIRSRLRKGETRKSLAEEYGVAGPTISDIRSGRNWGWLSV